MPERYFSIFCRQADDHVASLRTGLLVLERHRTRSSLLHELSTVAHALKGSALMVGVVDVAAIAEKLEEDLKGMAKGSRAIDGAAILRLAKGVDTISLITAALDAGEQPGVDVGSFLAEYAEGDTARPSRQRAQAAAASPDATQVAGFKTLDALENLIGEMRVKKNRLENGVTGIKADGDSVVATPETALKRFWRDLEDDVLYLDYRIRELREKTEAEVNSLHAVLSLPGRA